MESNVGFILKKESTENTFHDKNFYFNYWFYEKKKFCL